MYLEYSTRKIKYFAKYTSYIIIIFYRQINITLDYCSLDQKIVLREIRLYCLTNNFYLHSAQGI